MLAVGRRVVFPDLDGVLVDGVMYVPRRPLVTPGDVPREGALPEPPGANRDEDDERPKFDERFELPLDRLGETEGVRRVVPRELEPRRDDPLERVPLDRDGDPTLDDRLRELEPTLRDEPRDGALRPTLRLREGALRPMLREPPLDRPPPREIPPRLPPEPDPIDEPPDRRWASSRSGTSVTNAATNAKIKRNLDLRSMSTSSHSVHTGRVMDGILHPTHCTMNSSESTDSRPSPDRIQSTNHVT